MWRGCDRRAPAAYEAPTAVDACDPEAHRLDRREMVDAIDDLGRRVAYASRPVSKVVQGVLYAAIAVGVFASWLFGVLGAIRHAVMWTAIGLVFAVIGVYAVTCPYDRLPAHQFEIGPDPDTHPAAPDAAVVAQRSR